MAYDPRQHLINLKGKEYLPVAQRLVWFREAHPDWGIDTRAEVMDLGEGVAVFSATVWNADGKLMAHATKMETAKGFGDFVEKAETGAIGRALALCGFGTQFSPELEEGERVADAPHQPAQRAQGNGRPEGCTCAGKGRHFAENPNCALNKREPVPAARQSREQRRAETAAAAPQAHASAEAQRAPDDAELCEKCHLARLSADYVRHCAANNLPKLCEGCASQEYEPGATP